MQSVRSCEHDESRTERSISVLAPGQIDLADHRRRRAGDHHRDVDLMVRDFSAKVQWTLTLVIFVFAAGFISAAREHVVHPLQTMSNLLAALREGDYSIRARGARADDALGEVLLEVNLLGETLRVQRLGAFEATALLRTIMAEIDVAVFTFDPDRRLRLVNRAGENLLGQPIDKLARSKRETSSDLAAVFRCRSKTSR